ncbi:MAG TPA: hypothetical protein C5S50_08525 [Methanosarcinaceae archaeon]|nr:hypothetical protein [Methanosarcinaceae archaeon]
MPWKNECRIITRAVIRDKRNRLTTLEPKGEESGYVGFAHDITNEQSVPGLKITPKATILSRISELGKPYAFPLWGNDFARRNDGADGRGGSKKQKPDCNGLYKNSIEILT